MLLIRKLIIAVLTLGLVLSFSSAAIGYDDTNKKLNPIGENPNPLVQAQLKDYHNVSSIAKSTVDNTIPPQTVNPPVDRICQFIDYLEGGITSYYSMPNSYGTQYFGNKYTAANACTLKTIGLGVYGTAMLGAPDVEVTLWAGVGGYPTTVIKTWTFPYASLIPAIQYLTVDLTTDAGYPNDYLFDANDEFFIPATGLFGQAG